MTVDVVISIFCFIYLYPASLCRWASLSFYNNIKPFNNYQYVYIYLLPVTFVVGK